MNPVGIDFGTTFSSIFEFVGGKPVARKGNTGSEFVPTWVGFFKGWKFGKAAVPLIDAICDFKRMLGVQYDSKLLTDARKMWDSRRSPPMMAPSKSA
jgi:molecular chaperone DnaK (HSP70)